jgi:urease accessory protein UreH
MIAWQQVAIGRVHAGKTVTIEVGDTSLTVQCDDGPRLFRRTNDRPVTRIKAPRPSTPVMDG